MTRISQPALQASHLLDRRSTFQSNPSISKGQLELDGLTRTMSQEASNMGNLFAMTTGALAFRYSRLGLQSLGMAKNFSSVLALGGEVTTFRGVSNGIARLNGQNPHENILDPKGWMSTFINFGSLKLAGAIAANRNVFFTHSLQSTAMVGSQHLAYGLNLSLAPQGSLISQFAHAEGTNLALGAGHSLFNFASGGRVARAERALELRSEALSHRSARTSSSENLRRLFLPNMASVETAASRELPADWPAEFSPKWSEVRDGSRLYTPESSPRVRTNRELVKAILEQGVFGMLGKENVHAVIGYGSGFDGFKPEASVRAREIDNKIDLVVVVNNFEGALGHLAELWQMPAARRDALLATAQSGGVYCPNPDLLVKGAGLTGFKLTVVDRAHFYSEREGKPALHFAQFRVKDAIFANERDPRNRLLYIDGDVQAAKRLEGHIANIQDRMMDFAYNLRASFVAALRHPIRFFRTSFSGADLGRWFYQFSYDIEAYRFWEWSKGTKLFNKRSKEAAPILLGAIQRFAERYKEELKVTDRGNEINPTQITLDNLYDVRFSDRSLSSYVVTRMRSLQMAPVLFGMIRRAWSGSRAAMQSLKYSQSYEYIDNANYGGRKARGWIYKDDKVVYPLWALAHVLSRIAPNKIDSIQHPVIFTRLGIQINELYRKGKINDAEWEILNTAWMSDPAMTRLRNVPVMEVFDRNISTEPLAQQAYAKFLDSILQTPHMDSTVLRWVRTRRVRISQ